MLSHAQSMRWIESTYAVIYTICTPALCLLRKDIIIIDARLIMGFDAGFGLQSLGGVGWDVDECQRRYRLPIPLPELHIRLLEPIYNTLIDPIWLADSIAGRSLLLVVETTSAVEEPQDQARGVSPVGRVDKQVVVANACITAKDHLFGQCVGVAAFSSQDV